MTSPFAVSLIIDDGSGNVLLQLRDDKPTIPYPNCLGTFGGHSEANETPDETLQREISEELDEQFTQIQFWKQFSVNGLPQFVYYCIEKKLKGKKIQPHEGQKSVWVNQENLETIGFGFNGNNGEIVKEYFKTFYSK